MSRGFRPPPLAVFFATPEAGHESALAEARAEAFAEGLAQGLARGRAQGIEDGAAETREAMQPELDALREDRAKHEVRVAVTEVLHRLFAARDTDLAAIDLALRGTLTAALRTLFPALLASTAGTEITAIVAKALTERPAEALSLRAHSETLAAVADETTKFCETGRLILIPDDSRAFGAAEVTWTGGGMTFDPAALLVQVTDVLAAADVAAPPVASGARLPSLELMKASQ